jgi:hypothetical protein
MRLWTYILPAGLWLWFVRRHCERVPVGGMTASDAGRVAVIFKST